MSAEMYADSKFCDLSPMKPSGQTLWVYLLTGPFSTLIPGVVIGGEAGMSEALRWPLPAFRRCFSEVLAQRMAQADWKARVVFLPNGLRHNLPQSPSVVTGWRQAWSEVPACELKHHAAVTIRTILGACKGQEYQRAFEEFALRRSTDAPSPQAVPQPVTQAVPQPDSHQDQDQDQDLPPIPLPGGERAPRDARRPHPLDEPPVLEEWSVLEQGRFLATYPQQNGRIPAIRAWLRLNPNRETARRIIAEVTRRVALGWARELRFVPFPARFLDERMWEEPWTPTAAPAIETGRRVDDPDKTSAYLAEHRRAGAK